MTDHPRTPSPVPSSPTPAATPNPVGPAAEHDGAARNAPASASALPGPIPKAIASRSSRRVSWTWIIPILAVLGVGLLVYQEWRSRGRLITIQFQDGGGIQVNDPVVYRGVRIGRVATVQLSSDLNGVVIEAEINHGAAGSIAVEDSRFWIVHPVLTLTRVSGLETLLGPRYVEVEPGHADSKSRTRFVGLEGPPSPIGAPVTGAGLGSGKLVLILEATRRRSVTVGSPVLYREVKVGSVAGVELSADGQHVDLTIVIDAEHARLVRSNTKFWNASGIGVDFALTGGVSVKAGSLDAVLTGAVAFATPTRAGTRVENGRRFKLDDEIDKTWADWSPDLSEPVAEPQAPAQSPSRGE